MSVSAPEPVPVPEPEGAPLTHFEAWVSRHLAPDIADIRIKAENAIIAVRKVQELAPALEKLASLAVTIAKADPGISPAILADAEEAAGVVARVAPELVALGL